MKQSPLLKCITAYYVISLRTRSSLRYVLSHRGPRHSYSAKTSERVYIISRFVSSAEQSCASPLTAHKANCDRSTVEVSQDLITELQSHLQDVTDLTNSHLKECDHDGAANLRCNAIITMLSLLEIHRTLARSEVTSVAVRQHSRSRCGQLLSDITLTAQKVIVAHGKYLSSFIMVCNDK